MIARWKSLSGVTKFSIIAFVVVAILGLFSMGLLGAGLYYTVVFLHDVYPPLNDWRGDWVWPTTIMVGMVWSLGFLFAGVVRSYCNHYMQSIALLRTVYIFILWLWASITWAIALLLAYQPNVPL